MFSANSDNVKPVINAFKAGVHKVTELEVSIEPFKKNDDTIYEVIDIIFKNDKNSSHTHRLFEPKGNDLEKVKKSAQKVAKECWYILSKATGKDVKIEVSTFKELQELMFNELNGMKLTSHQIKLTANKNSNGKYYVGFVTYPVTEKNPQWGFGWFHNLSVDSELTLSQSEINNIKLMESSSIPKNTEEPEETPF